ncbi:MAG: cheY 3 [Acidobacteria bacterium]|jgi:CheY-like chemotaxis protein|nr:cheY 3 [Acidobacteriota bacterium]
MKTILVADDDKNLRRLYKAELEAEGYRIMLAENGLQATDIIERENPDVVVMDIRMPEVDGLEAMAKILKKNRRVPIILNSAYSYFQDDFLTWAADAYIMKSADLQPLKEKIREILCSSATTSAAV